MILFFDFKKNSLSHPQITIRHGESIYLVRNTRWEQFLAFLAYRKLLGIDDGWITLDDVAGLSSFPKISRKSIGKYFSNSSVHFPKTMIRFIKRHLRITTTGPYRLLIDSSDISADLPELERYISFIYTAPVEEHHTSDLLFTNAQRAFSRKELYSSLRLFHLFTDIAEKGKKSDYSRISLAHIQLAEIDRMIHGTGLRPCNSVEFAKAACREIKSMSNQMLILSLILSTEAMSLTLRTSNIARVIDLNNEALGLISRMKLSNPDVLCLLGGRYYHQYYITLRYGTPSSIRKEINKAIDYYTRMTDYGKPRIVNYEPGILDSIQLQSQLIKRSNDQVLISNEESVWYQELIESKGISNILTLNLGLWISKIFTKTRQLDRALEFTSNCLIDHAELHETAMYRRLKAERNRLRHELGC